MDDALRAWARAVACAPGHPAARAALAAPLSAHPHRATWFTRVAVLLLEAGAPELAEPLLRQALWLNPAEEAALLRLADLVARRGRTVGRLLEWDEERLHGTVETAGGRRLELHGAIQAEPGHPIHAGTPLELTVAEGRRGPAAADPAAFGRPDLPFGPSRETYAARPRIVRPRPRDA